VAEGQSINRSSVKYNIPARTLRDWMKRMNIKSVFTHSSGGVGVKAEPGVNPVKAEHSGSLDSRNPSTESVDSSGSSEFSNPPTAAMADAQLRVSNGVPSMIVSAFPGMTVPMQVVQDSQSMSHNHEQRLTNQDNEEDDDQDEEDEEEIDDDEDGIDSEPRDPTVQQ